MEFITLIPNANYYSKNLSVMVFSVLKNLSVMEFITRKLKRDGIYYSNTKYHLLPEKLKRDGIYYSDTECQLLL
jgi:transposase-like protein